MLQVESRWTITIGKSRNTEIGTIKAETIHLSTTKEKSKGSTTTKEIETGIGIEVETEVGIEMAPPTKMIDTELNSVYYDKDNV